MEIKEAHTIWIYCRINDYENIELLHFQADLLYKYAVQHNYTILGLSKMIDSGLNLQSVSLVPLINAIKDELIDSVLVYSNDRILCNLDAYTEFELLCLMHNISIINYELQL